MEPDRSPKLGHKELNLADSQEKLPGPLTLACVTVKADGGAVVKVSRSRNQGEEVVRTLAVPGQGERVAFAMDVEAKDAVVVSVKGKASIVAAFYPHKLD